MKQCEVKEESDAENRISRELRERLVRNLLDVIILTKLRESAVGLGGYDVIGLVYEEFDFLMSAGTIYASLYSMERGGLIESEKTKSKRSYVLTEKGKNKLKTTVEAKKEILNLVQKIVTGI